MLRVFLPACFKNDKSHFDVVTRQETCICDVKMHANSPGEGVFC